MALFGISAALLAFASWLLYRYSIYKALEKRAGNPPGKRAWIKSPSILSETLPKIKTFNINLPGWQLYQRPFEACKEYGSTIITSMSYIQSRSITYFVADPDAVNVLTTSKDVGKPLFMYKVLSFFGQNIVIVDGDMHRRHRKTVGPAFSETNNAYVWDQTLAVCDQWFADIDERIEQSGTGSTVEPDVVLSTMRAALMIISSAAFGKKLPWKDEGTKPPAGHALNFREALSDVLHYTIARVLTPRWMYKIPRLPRNLHVTLKKTETAYNELETYLSEFIAEREKDRKAGSAERKDLLSLLLNGAALSNGLSTDEVKGNTYIMLLAGHETTAHTLAFAFALLALYPEEQEKLCQESKEVFHSDTEYPGYVAYGQLVRALACFHETLRVFPPVPHIPKHANEDLILPAHRISAEGKALEKYQMTVPKGSNIMIDARSLHHNPSVWGDDCADFKVDRFIDSDSYRWPREAFLSFSGGSRSCVGQKFATIEGAAILSLVCRKYKLSLPQEDTLAYENGRESFAELKARTLQMKQGITLTPQYKRLVFTKR